MTKISVVGSGYVGLVTAVGLAQLGHDVICVDKDKNKVSSINSKKSPIFERGMEEMIELLVPKKLHATTNLHGSVLKTEVTFIAVGTPSLRRGGMDEKYVMDVSKEIGEVLKNKKDYHVVVVKSTVQPGTTKNKIIPLIEKSSNKKFGKDFGVVMNPETLREGTAITDFFEPDRIIVGSSDDKSIKIIKEVYKKLDKSIPRFETGFSEAEMIKYASNSMLGLRISFANEIGNICKIMEIDTNEVMHGIGLDKRIGPHFLRQGIGFGGSCFPKDINALISLAHVTGYNPELLHATLEVNKRQPQKIFEVLEKHEPLKNKKIGVLGLTFKDNTDDIRDSPALEIIKNLLHEGLNINAYDPLGMDKVKEIYPQIDYKRNPDEVIQSSDIILILTEWRDFINLEYGDKPVIDGKNVFYNGNGFKPKNYESVC